MGRLVRAVGRIFGVVFVVMFVTNVVSAIAAVIARARIAPQSDPASDWCSVDTIFGATEFRSAASSFRGGRTVTWYGASEIDLRGATLDPAGAHLEVWTLWGSTALTVPAGWSVRVTAIPILSGVDNQAEDQEPTPGAPVLDIRAILLFGALEIAIEAGAPAEVPPPDRPPVWPEVLPTAPA